MGQYFSAILYPNKLMLQDLLVQPSFNNFELSLYMYFTVLVRGQVNGIFSLVHNEFDQVKDCTHIVPKQYGLGSSIL